MFRSGKCGRCGRSGKCGQVLYSWLTGRGQIVIYARRDKHITMSSNHMSRLVTRYFFPDQCTVTLLLTRSSAQPMGAVARPTNRWEPRVAARMATNKMESLVEDVGVFFFTPAAYLKMNCRQFIDALKMHHHFVGSPLSRINASTPLIKPNPISWRFLN